jgi:hypothetical protein
MLKRRPFPNKSVDPVRAARRAMRANLVAEIVSKPLQSALVAALGGGSLFLTLLVIHAALERHAETLLAGMSHWGAAIWAGVFLVCLAMLLPMVRRDLVEAESGWLSALPQMPRALRRWSRRRTLLMVLFLAAFLVAAVTATHRLAPAGDVPGAFDWLPALLAPLAAWLVAPILLRAGDGVGAGPVSRRVTTRPRAGAMARPALVQWQWAEYRSRRWTSGVRWSLGLLALLLPPTVTVVQLGATLALGLLLLQWWQLWSSALHVIVRASALTEALPQRPWPFVRNLCGLPVLAACSLALFAFGTLACTGLSAPAALAVAAAAFAAFLLQAATVLAWRRAPRLLALRSAAVLLIWVTMSQAFALLTPVIWILMMAWLLRRAVGELV